MKLHGTLSHAGDPLVAGIFYIYINLKLHNTRKRHTLLLRAVFFQLISHITPHIKFP